MTLQTTFFGLFVIGLLAPLPVPGQDDCKCPLNAQGKREAPLVSVAAEDLPPRLIACGSIERRESPTRLTASSVKVFRCDNAALVLDLEPSQRAVLEAKAGKLWVTEVKRLPFGPAWEWIDVPYVQEKLWMGAPGELSTMQAFVMQTPAAGEAQRDQVLQEIRKRKGACGETLAGKALAIALTGDVEARRIFARLGRHCKLEGAAAKLYAETADIEEIFFDPRHGVHLYRLE